MFTYIMLSLCISLCRSNEGEPPLEYTDEDFSSKIANHPTALVMFYAPWCGHCKKLKPEYHKAAKELAVDDPPVALIKVDCTKPGKETCDSYEVTGYPALKIFRNGKSPQTYSGPRDSKGIVEYMRLQAGPSSMEFMDLAELDEYLKHEISVVVLGIFEEDTELKNAFLETADKLRDKVKFGYTSSKDVMEKYKANDEILLVRPPHFRSKFEDFQVKYSGNSSFEAINEFISKNYHGLVGVRAENNRDDFKTPFIIAFFEVDYKRNLKGTNYWRNRILKIAQQYKDKLTFAISHYDELKEIADVEYKTSPVIFAKNDNQKFRMEEDFSVDALDRFAKNFLDDNLEPFVKSEAIPKSNDGPVKIAVAKNFKEFILNNGKDTLIVLYSPWCGHCKKLMPTYINLAETLVDEDIVIAKIDATLNDVPEAYKLGGYPTIYWAAKDAKDKPIAYEDVRSVEDFIIFIAKHATEELKGYDRQGKAKVKDEL